MKKPETNITLAFVAVVIILIAVGAGVTYKLKYVDGRAKTLSSGAKPLVALPPGAATTITSPHEFRGLCFTCHPLANTTVEPLLPAQPAVPADPVQPIEVPTFLDIPPAQNPEPPIIVEKPRGQNLDPPIPLRAGGEVAQAAQTVSPMDPNNAGLLSPADQNAASKVIVEGHWLGMELMDLTPALRGIYGLSPDVQGVIVDEITLESAESGVLAGDVITQVGDRPTRDLKEFLRATEAIAGAKTANVVVNRLNVEKRFTLVAKNTKTVGFSQVEGAQPIKPGAVSPHRTRNRVCTECHVIMRTGGQLPVDEGDITPTPPPISASATAPHPNRGVCNSCHVITTP